MRCSGLSPSSNQWIFAAVFAAALAFASCGGGVGTTSHDSGAEDMVGTATGGSTGSGGGASGAGGTFGTGGGVATGGAAAAGGRGGSGGGGAIGGGGGVGGGTIASGGRQGTGGGASGGAPGTGGRGGTAGAVGGRSGTLRIMPFGDSTTGSVCWRAMLWQMLNQGGFTGRFDLVGTRHNDAGCNVPGYDLDNEGHPSILITNFINDADDTVAGVQTPQALLGQNPADVVLFHFATNDVWNSVPPATILAAYTTTLGALRAANPNVVVLVAQIIPLVPINTAGCPACACPTACDQRVVTFNGMLPAWATANGTATSPIMVVDQHTGFVSTTDTADGVHPNAAGSSKIATKWAAALRPFLQ